MLIGNQSGVSRVAMVEHNSMSLRNMLDHAVYGAIEVYVGWNIDKIQTSFSVQVGKSVPPRILLINRRVFPHVMRIVP